MTLTSILVALAVLAGLTFAYLSSLKQEEDLSATIGTVSISGSDVTFAPSIYDPRIEDDKIVTAANKLDGETEGELRNLNPGDLIPASFKVINEGTKSVVSKSYAYIIFDGDDYANNIELAEKFANSLKIYSNSAGTNEVSVTKGIYTLRTTTGTVEQECLALRFDVTSFDAKGGQTGVDALDGSQEKDASPESTLENGKPTITHRFWIKFAQDANMADLQGKSFSVKTFTKAIQYRNTSNSDLDDIMDDSSIFIPD